ncbi:phosphotransferase enzyme family protein [Alicyclobacillus fodiniaquatilis]|uniref:Phosphotransferase enzyme family protein n=1 Tax=Alicyclobacillus fodiniaquatilis TaxID=1661150 RepID=A0ABW4JHM2_9BACL
MYVAMMLAVEHSIPSASGILREILPLYGLEQLDLNCRLIKHGSNDTFLLYNDATKFIFRIYRHQWRTEHDVRNEIEYILHLHAKGLKVALPLPTLCGERLLHLQFPEGTRQAVMFSYASGLPLKGDEFADFGATCAKLHLASADFSSAHSRFPLDAEHLLVEPLHYIRPFLTERPDDWQWLQRIAQEFRDRLASPEHAGLEWGMCHGDLHPGNMHSDGGELVFFDFDCGGPSWRAYDLAVYLSILANDGGDEKSIQPWRTFITGYQTVKPLRDIDLKAIPLFVVVRQIWLMGYHTHGSRTWGSDWLHDDYFDEHISFLKRWIEEHELLG